MGRIKKKNNYQNTYRNTKKRDKAFLNFLHNKLFIYIFIFLGLSFFFVFSYDYLTNKPVFKLKKIEVIGEKRLLAVDIAKITGAGVDDNIFKINTNDAKKRLEENPWIVKADVFINFPSTLTIKLKEQNPIAVLDVNSQKFLVNDKGLIFKRLEEKENIQGLFVLDGFDCIEDKDKKYINEELLNAINFILEKSKDEEGLIQSSLIKKIKFDKEMGTDLIVLGVGEVLGEKEIKLGLRNYEEKYEKLKKIYENLKDDFSKILIIDLSKKEPIVRYISI